MLRSHHRRRLLAAVQPLLLVAAAALVALGAGQAPALVPAAVTTNQVAVAPPVLGWASWNAFFGEIDYDVIKAQADAMVSSGLAAAGYDYINIDEGWWKGARDSSGNITVDTDQWPGGMKAIADYIHSKGLKAGIYTDAGHDGCGYYYPTPSTVPAYAGTGSEDHYDQDMLLFEQWGYDMVKVDWCGGYVEGLDAQTQYTQISDAIAAATAQTGHQMVLSVCEWGYNRPWTWGTGIAPMWRTSTDIIYYGESPTMSRVFANFDQAQHPTFQHTGYVNDPDMLMVGMTGLTAAQNRTHLSLWAISGAPLLAGNNLATMSSSTAALLGNAEMLAVDQDPLGAQAVKVAEDTTGRQTYAKVLTGSGKRAVVLLNRTTSAATMTVRWADLGLTTASATVRDVWAGSSTTAATSYSTSVPAGEAVLLTVAGTESASTTYEAEAGTLAGGAATASCTACSGGTLVGGVGNGGTLTLTGVTGAATGPATATIAYVNGDSTARTATVRVNGATPTVVAFPPTGSWSTPGTVTVVVSLRKATTNTITVSNASAWAPDLDAVAVRPLPGAAGTEIKGNGSGRCLDINQDSISNGVQAQLWDCSGAENQTWVAYSDKRLVVNESKCLDAYGAGTTNGTTVVIWDCNGGTNQQWTLNSDGSIVGVASGKCLDAYNAGTTNGTKLVLWTCSSATNQLWTRN
ncbi:ricin-type beta-trefoil lectin domain protein [Actinoplanes sp. NPDC051851]|uniref:RICIN domain-containing protein n=1 Tax=Actinoplanes sp. NPDC051851 TaxID=3154753 RepID=UPI0034429DEB